MLVLTRKKGERTIIADGEIIVTLVDIRGNQVRLGITADKDIPVMREELIEKDQSEKTP